MEISDETARNLGNKLAQLELTNEEALLLTAALDDHDVSGFSNAPDAAGFEQAAPRLMPLIQGPINERWSGGQGGSGLWFTDGTNSALWTSDGNAG